jgi:hypothetical protein
MKVIEQIREKLTKYPAAYEIFSTTCFHYWLLCQNYNSDPALVHLILQTQVQTDDPINGLSFFIGGRSLTFGPRELCLVTGLKFGEIIPQNKRFLKPPFFKERIFNMEKPKLSDLLHIFNNDFDVLDDIDKVRVSMLLLVEFGFKGLERKNNLDSFLLNLIDDIGAWNQYPWGIYIWRNTYPYIIDALSRNKRDERKSCLRYSIKGFIWAFKVIKLLVILYIL